MKIIYKVILYFLILILLLYINHLLYGNRSGQYSFYEYIQEQRLDEQKKIESKKLSDFIYDRIKYYQTFDDISKIKLLLLWDNYEN